MDEKTKVDRIVVNRFRKLLDMKFSEIFSLIEFCWCLSQSNEHKFITDNEFLLNNKDAIERKLKNFKIISSFEAFGMEIGKEKEVVAA